MRWRLEGKAGGKFPLSHSLVSRTALTVAVGAGAWAAFALWGHAALIGVRPFGA